MRNKPTKSVWVVVRVESGVPVLADVYEAKVSAMERQRALAKDLREAYDSIGIFKASVKAAS